MRKIFLQSQYFLNFKQYSKFGTTKSYVRYFSSASEKDCNVENFDEMVSRRRSEAQRSIIVEGVSDAAAKAVWMECSAYGQVTAMMQYTAHLANINKDKKMLLVEFASAESAEHMMLHSAAIPGPTLPVRSPFFEFTAGMESLTKHCQPDLNKRGGLLNACQGSTNTFGIEPSHRQTHNINDRSTMPDIYSDNNQLSDAALQDRLASCNDVTEQMQLYHEAKRETELGSRLRFITCRQVELALLGPLPFCAVLPFGSTVNGFGQRGSDLDTVLQLQTGGGPSTEDHAPWLLQLSPCDSAAGWKQHQERLPRTEYLAHVADTLRSVTPGCTEIIRIFRARVPIVKYKQQLTGLQCDLSISNWSGLYMSEMLYHYSLLDRRVAPLVFCLRLWAEKKGLTSIHAGRWVTNFSITLLTLYYLIRVGALPSLQLLQQHARPEDRRTGEDGMDCSFLRDVSMIRSLHLASSPRPSQHADHMTLEQLLHGFFQFYDEFDFKNRAVSLVAGQDLLKPRQAALYIQNPLYTELNVSHNVTLEEMDKIRSAISRSCHQLQHSDKEVSSDWGVLSLCSLSNHSSPRSTPALNWQYLFDSESPNSKNNHGDKNAFSARSNTSTTNGIAYDASATPTVAITSTGTVASSSSTTNPGVFFQAQANPRLRERNTTSLNADKSKSSSRKRRLIADTRKA